MRIYLNKNVFDAALDRLRFIFQEFDNVLVSFSGGKDSTVILNLALIVAREFDRLPLPVLFIDQEVEWLHTIELVKKIMYSPEIEPHWLQIPIRIFNATSFSDKWLHCWNPEERHLWVREKDPISIKENTLGTDRFHDVFNKYIEQTFGERTANIGGVRAEESPIRETTLTSNPIYKWVTWGKVINKKKDIYTFYPIYDWSYRDVWAAIAKNKWEYNKIYDYFFQYGYAVKDMRVSNLHHETAVRHLFVLQEIEPENYAKVVKRLHGINTAKILGKNDFFITELPPVFRDWKEYRDYLLEKLVEDEKDRAKLKRDFEKDDKQFVSYLGDEIWKAHVNIIAVNDYHGTKLAQKRLQWWRKTRDKIKEKYGLDGD